MLALSHLLAFAIICVVMVITPGPNMAYLVSRSISQGSKAGFISLTGIGTGFLIYMLCAVLGLTALIIAVPFAYDVLRLGGAAYLLYLAWKALKPGGKSPFELHVLNRDRPRKLYVMGLLTSLLNPKVAMLYLSIIPQFVTPEAGDVLHQSLALGCTQIAISLIINSLVIIAAGSIATFLRTRPTWMRIQRWFMGLVIGGFAVRMALEGRR
jgi:threonine/homoserine/homoserine lactone efflux protein